MHLSRLRCSRRTAAAAVALGGLALTLATLPSRGQQGTPNERNQPTPDAPAIQATVSMTPRRTHMIRVEYEFTLPPGLRIPFHVSARVLNEKGERIARKPLSTIQRSPTWKGSGDVRVYRDTRGPVQVLVEFDYLRADGTRGVALVARPLTVP